jgi:hypothetical protein
MGTKANARSKRGRQYKNSYTSDFSAGADSWVQRFDITVAGNIDAIGGVDNTLRGTTGAVSGAHAMYRDNLTIAGVRYRVRFDYYIPSTNVKVNQVVVLTKAGAALSSFLGGLDAWTSADVDFEAADVSIAIACGDDGVANPIAQAGDLIYIVNFVLDIVG